MANKQPNSVMQWTRYPTGMLMFTGIISPLHQQTIVTATGNPTLIASRRAIEFRSNASTTDKATRLQDTYSSGVLRIIIIIIIITCRNGASIAEPNDMNFTCHQLHYAI